MFTNLEDLPESEGEAGQSGIVLMVMLCVLVLSAAGLAVDVSNLWSHRQAAQAAADAACQAGALDLLTAAAGESSTYGPNPPNAGTCTATTNSSICDYANYNGYNSAGPASSGVSTTTAWNTVSWSFPATVAGATAPSGVSSPYLQVSIVDNVQTFLVQLVSSLHFSQVKAQCTCGLTEVREAAPVIVLDPQSNGITYTGGSSLNIVGGPQRALQVNSSSTNAVTCSGSGVINTSKGGPNGTGSDVGITGDEPEGSNGCASNGGYVGFESGTTGKWRSNDIPLNDPYAGVPVPASVKSQVPATYTTQYGTATYYTWVGYHIDGCPDVNGGGHYARANGNTVKTNCAEFGPGYYPNGIPFPDQASTVIFLPGVYYLNGSLAPSGSNAMRMAMPCWTSYTAGYSSSACSSVATAKGLRYTQGSGVMFYFLTGTFTVSGGATGDTLDAVPSQALTCDGSTPPASLNMPATLSNNVLWAQCTLDGTYYDSGDATGDSQGAPGMRGLLFFQDHADTSSPSFTGSGQLSFSGSFYFHSTSYADVLNLSGGTSTGNFVIGDIVTDQISLGGSGAINLAIPPQASAPMLKVAAFE